MNLPLQLYDFISVLLPGIISLMIIKIEYPGWMIWHLESQYTSVALLFAVSYLAGNLIQAFPRVIKDLRKNFIAGVNTQSHNISKIEATAIASATVTAPVRGRTNDFGGTLSGRHSNLAVSKELENELKRVFKDYYNVDYNSLESGERFGLVYSPVHDRMGKREVFVAIANMNRSLAYMFAVYLAYITLKLIYYLSSSKFEIYWGQTVALFSLVVFSLILSYRNISYFRKMAEQIPIWAFLSWYKEKNIKNSTQSK